jgi:hypothetical protein
MRMPSSCSGAGIGHPPETAPKHSKRFSVQQEHSKYIRVVNKFLGTNDNFR